MKFIYFFALAVFFSCEKGSSCTNATLGEMHNLVLDGCGWVIKMNGIYYEPVNISEIDTDFLVEGKKVKIKYEEVQMGSICMVGPTISILCIQSK